MALARDVRLTRGASVPLSCKRPTFRALGSEHVDGRKTRLSRDAIPKINGKADIASPKRIPSAASDDLGAAILDDGRHREWAGAVEPNRVVGAAVEFQECVAIPTRAVTKAWPLGQR